MQNENKKRVILSVPYQTIVDFATEYRSPSSYLDPGPLKSSKSPRNIRVT